MTTSEIERESEWEREREEEGLLAEVWDLGCGVSDWGLGRSLFNPWRDGG